MILTHNHQATTTYETLTKFCSGHLEKLSTEKNSFSPYISMDRALECRVMRVMMSSCPTPSGCYSSYKLA